ncbi:ATP-binding protein [Spongiivirga sp. MCCC 1A20706]|uniref:ATP-binding response regulator n=1 Tax=Spongiivirga sp. MCCC 1A20706 TaxID=3160963 RepID=UPI003977B100
MSKAKKSITTKVIFGYILVTAVAAFAVVFLYNQLPYFSKAATTPESKNEQLLIISNTLTNLYAAEISARAAMQSGSKKKFETYQNQITTIKKTIDSLLVAYPNPEQVDKLDSIKVLLDKKTATVKELSSLKRKELSKNYYKKAIDELSKTDIIFEDYENDPRLADYDPYVKRVIVDYLEFLRSDNKKKQHTDSLALAVKKTLAKLNEQNMRFKKVLSKKERSLLESDQTITNKIRGILVDVEKGAILRSIQQNKQLESRMSRTAKTLKYTGFGALFIILVFILIIARDNKKRYEYEQQLETSKKYAESILKSKEQLMAAITHDLRAPLTTISGFTELLEQTDQNKKQRHYINQLKSATNFTLQLVNDLLVLSKLQSNKVTIEPKTFEVASLLDQTFNELTNSAPNPRIKYILDIEKIKGKQIVTDPLRIKQIVVNLLSNAIKFTENGSISLRADIDNRSDKPYLIVDVTDTGIGIAKDKQELIFEEFTQADNDTEDVYGGSGLGLTIAKKLTYLLGGSISVISALGEGCTFRMEIPVDLDANQTLKENKNFIKQKDISNLKNKSILIVDDDPNQLTLLKEVLSRNGLNVTARNNAKRALSILKERWFDLVITDIQMPNYDGFWFVDRLQKNGVSTPIIALSGRTDLSIDAYINAGFIIKVDKPYKSQFLLEALATVLSGERFIETKNNQLAETKNNIIYDLSEIGEFVQGDSDAVKKILEVFIENTKEQLVTLQKHTTNRTKIGYIAHRLTPMFKQIGSKQIVTILEVLEFNNEALSDYELSKLIEDLGNSVQFLFSHLEDEISQSHTT